jgi:hypothetical protein
VLVSAARVAVGRIRGGRFTPERTALWDALAPPIPVPTREPLAAAAVTLGSIAVGSTDRGAVRLTGNLAVEAPLAGLPVWGGDDVVCLMPEPSAGAFDGAPVECSIRRDPRPRMAVPAPRFDAFGSAVIADEAGNARPVVAVREPSGRMRLKSGDALGIPDGTFGAQLAVGDLDQDGIPEVVTSADLPPPAIQAPHADDAVDVASWTPGTSELHPRLHLPAPDGVRALAVCPPEDHAQPALIAVVGSEIWIVRAAIGAAPGGDARKAGP